MNCKSLHESEVCNLKLGGRAPRAHAHRKSGHTVDFERFQS